MKLYFYQSRLFLKRFFNTSATLFRSVESIKINGPNIKNIRNLSICKTLKRTALASKEIIPKDELNGFKSIFPNVVKDLTKDKEHLDLNEAFGYLKENLEYNVPHNTNILGQIVFMAYKHLESPEKLTSDNIKSAYILGWCVELLYTFIAMIDDFLDQSETRRGAKCWPKLDEIGIKAINDSFLLEAAAFTLARKHFSNHPYIREMLMCLHEMMFMATVGQSLNHMTSESNKSGLENFTKDRWEALAYYKTGSGHLKSVSLVMYLANIQDPVLHQEVQRVMKEMGIFYHMENDFLNCFGEENLTGQVTSNKDIIDKKCTWLAVVALQKGNSTQRKIMESHYGKNNTDSVQAIRNLYEELNLREAYANYKQESFGISYGLVENLPKDLPRQLFFELIDKIYSSQE